MMRAAELAEFQVFAHSFATLVICCLVDDGTNYAASDIVAALSLIIPQ